MNARSAAAKIRAAVEAGDQEGAHALWWAYVHASKTDLGEKQRMARLFGFGLYWVGDDIRVSK